jgi:hypothetical protein
MLEIRPGLPASLAMNPQAPPEFKLQVWNILQNRSAHDCRVFFKAYRATLPKATQVEVTQRQKDILLALPARNAKTNAWLAEVSADLVALQLDQ